MFFLKLGVLLIAKSLIMSNFLCTSLVYRHMSELEYIPYHSHCAHLIMKVFFIAASINQTFHELGYILGILLESVALKRKFLKSGETAFLFVLLVGAVSFTIYTTHIDGKNREAIAAGMLAYALPAELQMTTEIDSIQDKLHCCGISGFGDYNKFDEFSCFKQNATNCTLPWTCFRKPDNFVELRTIHKIGTTGVWIDVNPLSAPSKIYFVGCEGALKAKFQEMGTDTASCCATLALLQIFFMCIIRVFVSAIENFREQERRH